MSLLRFSSPLVLLCSALVLQGCAQWLPYQTQFYQLEQGEPKLPKSDKGPAVLLGPLTLADYLQRENLIQREPDDSLTVSQRERWAGSLEDDVGQLLLRQLAGQLNTSRIVLYPDRVGFDGEVQVLVHISRLDSGAKRPAVLEAQWRLLDGAGTLRSSRLVRLQEAHLGTPVAQVHAQSLLLQRLAEQLTDAINNMPQAEPVALPKAKPPVTEKRLDNAPQMPVIEPAKQMDVFRF
nr:PqiC family protein [uncultured Pseudomonas sp.]